MVVELLRQGEENARTAKDIAIELGVEQRDVTRAIEAERKDGALICAGAKGYFLARDPTDAKRYTTRLSRRIGSITRTRDAMAAAIKERET